MPTPNCPCGLSTYDQCCEPLHQGEQRATDAQKLMRSRYSAYVLGLEDYLRTTWHPSTCPSEKIVSDEPTQWLELKIKNHSLADDGLSATVEFIAIYKVNGKAHRLHEISSFVYEHNQWFYVDGVFPEIK